MCCSDKQVCNSTDSAWVATPASSIQGAPLTICLAVPSSCASKPINGLRYLWRETPCLFKQAAVYNSEDSNLPAPPYLNLFRKNILCSVSYSSFRHMNSFFFRWKTSIKLAWSKFSP